MLKVYAKMVVSSVMYDAGDRQRGVGQPHLRFVRKCEVDYRECGRNRRMV